MSTPTSAPTPLAYKPIPADSEQARRPWVDEQRRRPGHVLYQPTANEAALIDIVQGSVAQGITYLEDLANKVIQAFGLTDLTDEQIRLINSDVYQAKIVINARDEFASKKALAESMRLQIGAKLGTLVLQGKVTTGVVVTGISDCGLYFDISAMRGSKPVTAKLNPYTVFSGIRDAHENGKRKDGFEQFVQGRESLPSVTIDADPLKAFLLPPEIQQQQKAAAQELLQLVDKAKSEALTMVHSHPPGSVEHMRGELLYCFAKMNQIEADILWHEYSAGKAYNELHASLILAQKICGTYAQRLTKAFPGVPVKTMSEMLLEIESRKSQAPETTPLPSPEVPHPPEVVNLAKLIIQSIGEHVYSTTEKSLSEQIQKNYITQAQANSRLRSVRETWANQKPDSRNLTLAKAILDKDPVPLVHTWAQEGQGVDLVRGSLKAFQLVTGINLATLNSTRRAQTLYEWAGWRPEQIENEKARLQHVKAVKAHVQQVKDCKEALDSATTIALDTHIRLAVLMDTVKGYVDDLYAIGYNKLVKRNDGAGSVYILGSEESGMGYSLSKMGKIASDYIIARDAYEQIRNKPLPQQKQLNIAQETSPDTESDLSEIESAQANTPA